MALPSNKPIYKISKDGKLFLIDQRTVIFGVDAFGLLRRDLITALGRERARAFLTRYGWNCGYHDAVSLKKLNPGLTNEELYHLSARMHSMQGVAKISIERADYDNETGMCHFDIKAMNSYEAEQHIIHFGLSEEVGCWSLSGYASGFKSAVLGKTVVYKEIQCVAKGDSCCRLVGMTPSQWGMDAENEMRHYHELDVSAELVRAYGQLNKQHNIITQSVSIHNSLINLISDGQELEDIVVSLAELSQCEVACFGHDLKRIVVSPNCCRLVDIAIWQNASLSDLEYIRKYLRVMPVGQNPGKGINVYSMVSPVYTGKELLGFLAFFRNSGPFAPNDALVIEQGAMVCALALLRLQNQGDVTRGNFVHQLAYSSCSNDKMSLAKCAKQLGLATDSTYTVMIVSTESIGASVASIIVRNKDQFSLQVDERLVQEKDDCCFIILHKTIPDAREEISTAHQIKAIMGKSGLKCFISIGGSVDEVCDLSTSFEQARETMKILRCFDKEEGILHYRDIEAYKFLFEANSSATIGFMQRLLLPIIDYDQKRQAGLLKTLDAYLLSGGSVDGTAEKCSIHPSGVKYRLKRIEKITSLDLGDAKTRFDLQMALFIYKIQSSV